MTQEPGPKEIVTKSGSHNHPGPTDGNLGADWLPGMDPIDLGRTTRNLGAIGPQDDDRETLGTIKQITIKKTPKKKNRKRVSVAFQDPLLNELISNTSADDNTSTHDGKQ